MVQIISCGKNTLLNEFPSLKKLSSYEHKDENKHDFQFYSNNKLFLKSNAKSEIEFLRIKQNKGEDEIAFLKKVRVENLLSIACPKASRNDFAVGLTTGHIKLINYKTSDIVQKFNPELQNNSVTFLDYSICDEYLAGIYENGNINVFGLKTGVKLNKLTFDEKNVTMVARFHPVKKLQLAIGSYSGNVSIYDLQTKRFSYSFIDAHDAPCRDVCMSAVHPDCLITAGYDSLINIFDLRKKTSACQILQKHPISSINLSNCGNYCCTGDLKGTITCYDFRNLKEVLNSMKTHDTNISRVSFVPQSDGSMEQTIFDRRETRSSSSVSVNSRLSLVENIDKALLETVSEKRDSFWDDISHFQQKRNTDFSPTTRLSFGSRLTTDSRVSLGMGARNFLALLDSSGDISTEDHGNLMKNLTEQQEDTLINQRKTKKSLRKSDLLSKNLVEKSEILEEITEENLDNNDNKIEIIALENKENYCLNISHKEGIESFMKLPDNKNSTPNQYRVSVTQNNLQPTLNNLNGKIDILSEKFTSFETNIRQEINEKFDKLNNELKCQFNDCILRNYSGTFNLMKHNKDALEDLTYGIGMLLHSEPFVTDYINLKNENSLLREQIEDLKKK